MGDPVTIVAQCCFLDVGQGTCNIVLLGERKAAVIDCGPRRAFPVIQALEYFGVEHIEALVISHNDADHCGGAELILSRFQRSIDKVYFLQDRPSADNRFLARVQQEIDRGTLSRKHLQRLEDNRIILERRKHSLKLRTLFPTMLDNIKACDQGAVNATCGVVRLEWGARSIVFLGDVGYQELRRITDDGRNPIHCDIATVPHHGGGIENADYSWLYKDAIKCKTAILSVGTSNTYGHPAEDHVQALRQSGATVMCTQITSKCSQHLEALRPGVRIPTLPGVSKPTLDLTNRLRRSRNVACAGTILVSLSSDGAIIEGLDTHHAGIEAMCNQSGGRALCRPKMPA